MGTTVSKDIGLYYETQGQGSDLLLINGLGASGLSWEPAFLEGLARHHRVIVPDNRGTGRSDKPDKRYTISDMAGDSIAILDTLGAERAHVLGVSMGGLVAEELALSHRERVSSLILCCTSCGWRGRSDSPQKSFARLFLRPKDRLKVRMEMLYTKDFLSEESLRIRELWEKASRYPTPIHSYRRQWIALTEYNCCDRLSDIRAPTLIMGGDMDHLNHIERLRELAEGIPGAELKIYPGLGHGFILEARDKVLAQVLHFLREQDMALGHIQEKCG